MASTREYEGKTLNEALDLAAEATGSDRLTLRYEILDDGRRGFLGLGWRPVRIRLLAEDEQPARSGPAALRADRAEVRRRGDTRSAAAAAVFPPGAVGRSPGGAGPGGFRGGDQKRGRGRDRGGDPNRVRTTEPGNGSSLAHDDRRGNLRGVEHGNARGDDAGRKRGGERGKRRGGDRSQSQGGARRQAEGGERGQSQGAGRGQAPSGGRGNAPGGGRGQSEGNRRGGGRSDRQGGGDGRTRNHEDQQGPQSAPIQLLLVEDGTPYSRQEAVRRAANGILSQMQLELRARLRERDEAVVLDLSGADAPMLLADEGEGLEALQHVLNKVLARDSRFGWRVVVDCDGFRERHDEALLVRARSAADDVRRTGEPVHLDGLNPYERRLIHVEFAEQTDLTTFSTGEGMVRRLTIALQNTSGSEAASED